LLQAIYAKDYRGATMTFSGEIRTDPRTEQAGLRLLVFRYPPDAWRGGHIREDRGVTVSGRTEWTRHEITALVPWRRQHDRVRHRAHRPRPGRAAKSGTGKSSTGKPGTAPGRAMSQGIADGDLVRLARDGDAVAASVI
jgi:hypothetical protein